MVKRTDGVPPPPFPPAPPNPFRGAAPTSTPKCMVCTTPTRCGAPALHTKGPRCIGRADGKDDCDCLNACGDDPWIESGRSIPCEHRRETQARIAALTTAAPAAVAGPSQETCQTCQGNGEVITDWERYKHPLPGDVGDEAVAECQDCDGQGTVDAAPTTQAAPAVELGALQAEIAGHEAANLHLSGMVDELRELLQDAKRAMTELHKAAIPDESSEGVPAIIPPDAFRAFVDAHAKLCFCLHQRGHNPAQEGQ